MATEMTGTNASKVASALLTERGKAGSPSMGMVMTVVVVTDEGDHYDALRAARTVSREHPSRILGVIRRSARGAANLDAEIKIGDGGSGEQVLLRMSGELSKHSESVVLPLLLPDSPVVVWWPGKAPDDPAADPLGALAQRRITDIASMSRGRAAAMLQQAQNYQPGNTDLSWTRLTPWRALLAAALDQYLAKVTEGEVAAERSNPSADLLAAWLTDRLGVRVERTVSKGPGVTRVRLVTGGGNIEISRPDGVLADFSIPNAPNRPVALKRRQTAELLAEELRRLDPDDIYQDTVQRMCLLARRKPPEPGPSLSMKSEEAQRADDRPLPGGGTKSAMRSAPTKKSTAGSGTKKTATSGAKKKAAPKRAASSKTGKSTSSRRSPR
ncbi:MAG: glucose-6-phosphate dehydrogenase assembly protein OpcA [Propionibacteriales bacterium]|nr:glucose-6-phosphate dehydrogenase assembly protein OpcA [Propionibacteriales bacterium]